ncbi:MAG: hypothetical protein WBZ50_03970 [Nitrososphaeraceae archaeon]
MARNATLGGTRSIESAMTSRRDFYRANQDGNKQGVTSLLLKIVLYWNQFMTSDLHSFRYRKQRR